MKENYKEYIKKDIDILLGEDSILKGDQGINDMFFIYLSHFEFFIKIGNYMEAHNSLTDLFCYDTKDSKIRYHLNCALSPYKEVL